MPAFARKDSTDSVASPDGSGPCCVNPSTQSTDAGSGDVFVNDIGAVRKDDTMIVHNFPGPCCVPHSPALSTYSPTVFANDLNVGRLGDAYGSDHVISSGSPDVFVED